MELDDIIKDIREGLVLLSGDDYVGITIKFQTPGAGEVAGKWIAKVASLAGEELGDGPSPYLALARMRITVIHRVRKLVAEAEKPTKWLRELKNKPPMELPPPLGE